jgi:hypothetical protein
MLGTVRATPVCHKISSFDKVMLLVSFWLEPEALGMA